MAQGVHDHQHIITYCTYPVVVVVACWLHSVVRKCGSVWFGQLQLCVTVTAFLYPYHNLPVWLHLQEERKKRLGPGGLDPVEVMETLPVVSETLSLIHMYPENTLCMYA